MSLLIKNGEIISDNRRHTADIFCEDTTITKIGQNLSAPADSEVIDATGNYVFPGFIDPHVHIYLPFMGTFAKDTYETGSQAALIGGTTTFFEMCVPSSAEEPRDAFALWNEQSIGKSACDWSYHMGVSKFDDSTADQLREIVAAGVASFKVFLAYKGAFGIDDETLYKTLKLAKELGVIVTAHCENEDLIAANQADLLAAGKTGPEWHHESRPPSVEADGVHHLCTFAEMTGAHVYIVHTSCEPALKAAMDARLRGVNVAVETLATYLVCDKSFAERPNFEGAKWVMSPPIRDKHHQSVLWNGLTTGVIDTVGTDHAPFDFEGQKPMGKDDFTTIPNGVPSIEDRINLLYTYGVKTGKLSLERFVEVASTKAAKLFGLYPRKGTISEGADADIVVYDPEYRGVISAATQRMNVDYSGFEDTAIEGRPSTVTVRGKIQVRDGAFIGDPSWGEFLRRKPTH